MLLEIFIREMGNKVASISIRISIVSNYSY